MQAVFGKTISYMYFLYTHTCIQGVLGGNVNVFVDDTITHCVRKKVQIKCVLFMKGYGDRTV